jgi:hypothetical protein
MRMLSPVHQVRRRKCIEKDLLPVRGRISRIDPILFSEYRRLRVGIPAGKKGITARHCSNRLPAGMADHKKAEKAERELPHHGWNLWVNIRIVSSF